jgi:ArsR family transcriptional regulator
MSSRVKNLERGPASCIPPIDNIDVGRYAEGMAKIDDPDIHLLQALADPTRLAIVRQLARDGEVCACDLTNCCQVGQPTVSHHLKVLRESGLARGERRGSWVWYSLEPTALARLSEIVGGLSVAAPTAAEEPQLAPSCC